MIEHAKSGLAVDFAAALDWWRDAGVDGDWQAEPQIWIAPPGVTIADPETVPERAQAPVRAAAPAPVELDRAAWPSDLAQFGDWWRQSEWLDSAPPENRVPPRGAGSPALMVLVAEPEPGDRDHLLAGPQGRLLDAMLAAMGVLPAAVYAASILPRPMPHADWPALAARGLGQAALHHIKLVAPSRLIVFGANILPLLGHDPANNPTKFGQINHGGGTTPMLALRDLAVLLERPRWKAGVWQSWLDWTQGGI